MAITGQQLINNALVSLGVMPIGQTPNGSESAFALLKLNAIIDNANIQEEMATSSAAASVPLTAGTEGYNLATRLSRLVSASLVIASVGGNEVYPLKVINAQEYNNIEDKNALTAKPTAVFYDGGFPTGQIHLVQIPNAAFSSVSVLGWAAQSLFTVLSTSLTLLPGYERYLVTELAIELAPSYPLTAKVSDALVNSNTESKNEIRKLNAQLWGIQATPEGAVA